jgi:anti-sigma regulatory factor (Ser/Thr protein kinase)
MSREGPHRDAAPAARTGERLRLRLLERAAARVGSTLDLFRTASELAGAAVPGFAEVAVVELADVVLRGEAPPPGPWDDSAAVRRAAVAGAGGGSTRAPGDVWVPRSGSPHALALADLRPRLVTRLAADRPWAAEEPALERLLRDGGAASMIAAPLVVRGAALGLACFYRTGAAFDAEDLAAAAGLAAFAATSVDNARRHTREKALARLVQRTLVPGRLPTHVAASTACTYRPVAAGGSWFDVVPLSGARIACVVGEVSGHGMPAVSLMGQVSAAVATLAGMDLPPDAVLGRVHDLVVSSEVGRSTLTADGPRADGLTVGCVIACYDPVAGRCTVARAGHPAPTVVLPDGGSTVVEAAAGPALGGQGRPSYPLRHLALPAGSVLALHTAAVPDPGPFLSRSLASAGGDLHEVSDGVLAEAFPDGPTDDFILFLARTRILGPDRTRAWRLPNRAESAGTARRAAARQLAGWGLADMVPSTELLVSELVTNAVRYSDGDVELRLIVRENTLACEVTDTGRAAPTLRRAQDDEEGGRGLFLVARLTLDWGVRTAARGKTVWAEQLLPGRDGTDPED